MTLDAYLKRTYKMPQEEYETQLIIQGGVCAICKSSNKSRGDEEPERLSVDHSHYSGANRGLLCQRCNKVLGMVLDSQELLIRMLEYLRKHDGSQIHFLDGRKCLNAVPISVHTLNYVQPD